jgi:peptidoglycan/xylan/chitin deacetylase (PgdA/CDA1 family)
MGIINPVLNNVWQPVVTNITEKSLPSNWTPQNPTGLTATVISDTQNNLLWTNVDTKGDGVKIERSIHNANTYSEIGSVSIGVSIYRDKTALVNTYYDYRIRAYKGSIHSGYSSIVGASSVFRYYDTFTDINSTALASHTMNVGSGWTVQNGTWVITGNQLAATSTTAAVIFATTQAGGVVNNISIDFTVPAGLYYFAGIVFRYQDLTHKWMAYVEIDGSGVPVIALQLNGAGGTYKFIKLTASQKYRLEVIDDGTIIKVLIDGIVMLSTSDTSLNDKTLVGVAKYKTGSYPDVLMDNFIIHNHQNPYKRIAGITLSFDDATMVTPKDNLNSWIYAENILKTNGWKANFAIATQLANTTNQNDIDEITSYKTDLDILIAGGHEICNHTIRHTGLDAWLALPDTRQNYYDNRIAPMQTILENIFTGTTKNFRYPNWYGTIDSVMNGILIAAGYNLMMNNVTAIDNPPLNISYYGYQQIYALDIAPYNGVTFSDAQIISLLDYARDNNWVVNIFSHRVVASNPGLYEVAITRLQTICQYMIDNDMKMYKLSELNNNLFGL